MLQCCLTIALVDLLSEPEEFQVSGDCKCADEMSWTAEHSDAGRNMWLVRGPMPDDSTQDNEAEPQGRC